MAVLLDPYMVSNDSAHLEVRQLSCLKNQSRQMHWDCRGMQAISYRQVHVEVQCFCLLAYFPLRWCSFTVWMHNPRKTGLKMSMAVPPQCLLPCSAPIL